MNLDILKNLDQFDPDQKVLDAMKKVGDLLIDCKANDLTYELKAEEIVVTGPETTVRQVLDRYERSLQ